MWRVPAVTRRRSAHVAGPAAGMAEIRRLESYMRRLNLDPLAHQDPLGLLFPIQGPGAGTGRQLSGGDDLIQQVGREHFSQADVRRIERHLTPGS